MGLWKKLFGGRNREKAEALVQQGYVAARKGKPTEALAAYEKAVAADESYPLAWLNMALALQDLYNLKARALSPEERSERLLAIFETLEKALELDPLLVPGWRCLGHVGRRLTRYARAEEAFERVLDLTPRDHEHRAEVERELKAVRDRAARERSLAEVRAVAADADAHEELLRATLERARTVLAADAAEVRADDEPALVADASFRWATAVICRRLKERDQARALLDGLLADAPLHVGALRDRATLALEDGDVKTALEHSMAAYREDPLNAALVCNVGVCHLTLGNLGEAGEFLRMAQDLDPKDPIVSRAFAAYRERLESQTV